MQTTSRIRETGPSYAVRKGHAPQLSISDDNHHVTEVLGYMYDDDDTYANKGESPPRKQFNRLPVNGGQNSRNMSGNDGVLQQNPWQPGLPSERQIPGERTSSRPNGQTRSPVLRNDSWEKQNGAAPPPVTRGRAPSDTATTQFPLNDIDYESSPAAVAQELSNLQALRRMSMDMTAPGDPDLPALSPASMPAAPSASDSEDDSSRLFWVPARLHPELAPKEFKSFLESKADQIKRRSGELSSFASGDHPLAASLSPQRSIGGGLGRKKSMLSRQIDNSNGRGAEGYQDGAERLERKRSRSGRTGLSDPNLEQLESLVTDGTQMRRMSLDSPDSPGEDVILPSAPGQSLRRSTRTQYRRGSTNKGQPTRASYARRAARAGSMSESTDSKEAVPGVPTIPDIATMSPLSPEEIFGISRSNTDPLSGPARTTNFSRPGGRNPMLSSTSPPDSPSLDSLQSPDRPSEAGNRSSAPPQPQTRQWQSSISSHGRSSLQVSPQNQAVPQIVLEAPKSPAEEKSHSPKSTTSPPQTPSSIQSRLPERKSSREEGRSKSPPGQRPPIRNTSPLNSNRPMPAPSRTGAQSLEQMSSHPSPLPGNDTNTGNLSFIPTFAGDKNDDKRFSAGKKEETKKSGWGWLLGKDETESKDKRLEGIHNKPKAKTGKQQDKHDSTRLDVLQSSIDGGKGGRESLVLDRSNLKLEEERKKESARKSSSGDGKKEKDGLFSSLFGGAKKNKGEREATGKKHQVRGLSPDPPHRALKPDVDYNWTRFSILEERAIYRMAHIKLANPKRALYSQVLLSNFMYSYLAKVQQMHPQMNLPTSAKQQKKQQQQQQQPGGKDQPDEFTQYQRYQQQQQQSGDQQQSPYGSSAYGPGADHEGDSSMYDYDGDNRRPSSRGSKHGLENGGMYGGGYGGGYHSTGQHSDFGSSLQGDDDDDDMW